MENWLFEIFNLPQGCKVEEVLPKGFLSRNFEMTAGEVNLQNYTVKEMAIVGAMGPEYVAISANDVIENAVLMVVEMIGGKFEKEAKKVAEMLHRHLPQHLIIGLTDGESACLSIARLPNEDSEVIMSSVMEDKDVDRVSEKLDFEKVKKTTMLELWNEYCEIIATI